MSLICPHCRYVRKVSDAEVPDWQCPQCHRAYNKSETTRDAAVVPVRAGGGWAKWLLVLALLGAAGWYVRQPARPAMERAAEGQPEVVLYSTSWCGYCAATRAFFERQGIAYREQDIERSTAAYNEHRRLGGNGVPLVLIGDQVIKGYDEAAMRQQLAPWLQR